MALLWSLWSFITVLSLFCPIVPWTDDRSSLLGGIPFEAPACSWTSPEFAPAFREPPENRYVTSFFLFLRVFLLLFFQPSLFSSRTADRDGNINPTSPLQHAVFPGPSPQPSGTLATPSSSNLFASFYSALRYVVFRKRSANFKPTPEFSNLNGKG